MSAGPLYCGDCRAAGCGSGNSDLSGVGWAQGKHVLAIVLTIPVSSRPFKMPCRRIRNRTWRRFPPVCLRVVFSWASHSPLSWD